MFITPDDLAPFASIDATKAAAMIADAEAMAILVAPCLPGLTTAPDGETEADAAVREARLSAVKAILRGAILRWEDAGSGAVQQQTAGPFSQTVTPQARKSMFWPSEIEQLQGICSSQDTGKAFTIDTAPAGLYHSPICALYWGAGYCSCGADIAGRPIYESGV
jgi:hypothetical protein